MQTDTPRPLTDVLLVAGPSGAGKSTFIQQLLTGHLAPELRALLPEDAGQWTSIDANGVQKGRIPLEFVRPDAEGGAGVILHYDTLVIPQRGINSYALDPVFSLLDAATKIAVVNVHPAPETVVFQFGARQYLRMASKGRASMIWSLTVREPLRRARQYVGMARQVETSQIYRDPARVQHCYEEWDAFSRELVRGKTGARLLHVEPRRSFVVVPPC